MSMFTLATSCLTTSNLPWFMDLTFQVPMQYCSLHHRTLLLSPVTMGHRFHFDSICSFFQWCSSWIYKRQRNQKSNCQHPFDHRKSKRVPGKKSTSALLTTPFDCMDHNKLWKIFEEMGIPDHFTCLLRNLYAGQEATFRTGHGTTNWFWIGKGVHQGCILSPWLFNFPAECFMWNARLDEAQAGIKISRRNINNLIYAHDTTLMAEGKEELETSWWKWKRRVKKLA